MRTTKLKELSEEYGVDLSTVRRIAILNNFNLKPMIDQLDNIVSESKNIYSDRLKEYKPNSDLNHEIQN